MCLFLYHQCKICRFPDTRTISLGHECPAFQQDLSKGTVPSLNDLFAQIGAEFSPLHVAGWTQHESSLCRKLGEGWQIRPSRDCIAWSAAAEQWICLACEVRKECSKKAEAEMTAAKESRALPMARSHSRAAAMLGDGARQDVILSRPETESVAEELGPDPEMPDWWPALVDYPYDNEPSDVT